MLKNLRALREERGVTQKPLADAIDVSQQSINKYENHNIEPDIETLIRIADYFETSVDYLVGHSELRRRIEPVTGYDLNAEERDLIEGYRRLSPKRRQCLRTVLESYE